VGFFCLEVYSILDVVILVERGSPRWSISPCLQQKNKFFSHRISEW